MNLLKDTPSTQRFENLHILFWLIKDSCWMLEFKLLGTLMILPTLSVAIWIVWFTRKSIDLYINLAVFFWILANSAWMLMEFNGKENLKLYTVIPFVLGILFTLYFYFVHFLRKNKAT